MKIYAQTLTADEFTGNFFAQTILPTNSRYLDENEEFQGGGGRGSPDCT
jgi:hypothetical protein